RNSKRAHQAWPQHHPEGYLHRLSRRRPGRPPRFRHRRELRRLRPPQRRRSHRRTSARVTQTLLFTLSLKGSVPTSTANDRIRQAKPTCNVGEPLAAPGTSFKSRSSQRGNYARQLQRPKLQNFSLEVF